MQSSVPPDPATGRRQFGLRLRELRRDAGLSQEALGERCTLDRKTINRIENGTHSTLIDHVLRIAAALNCRPRELFTWPDD